MNDQPESDAAEEAGHDLPLADHPLTAGRLAQHQARVAEGAYPYRYERTATAAALHERYGRLEPAVETEDEVSVAGRVMLLRSFGKLVFVTLQDATGRIQLFIDRRSLGDDTFAALGDVDLGDWLGATGTMMTTKKRTMTKKARDKSATVSRT